MVVWSDSEYMDGSADKCRIMTMKSWTLSCISHFH